MTDQNDKQNLDVGVRLAAYWRGQRDVVIREPVTTLMLSEFEVKYGVCMPKDCRCFFLHADCRVSRGGLAEIETALSASPCVVGGNFRLVFDGHDGFSRWLTGFYAWFRGRGLYYGDSGVFVRRETHDAIGGVRPIALMEDFDFTRRLERFGPTCCIEDPPLITSSRRFEGRHPLRIIWGWLKIHALFFMSVSPARLARTT